MCWRNNRSYETKILNNNSRFTCDLLTIIVFGIFFSLQEAAASWWILVSVSHNVDQRCDRVLIQETIYSWK